MQLCWERRRPRLLTAMKVCVWTANVGLLDLDSELAGEDACARAPESASGQRGESPLQANALRPVTECNCDAAMRGGEQQEVNDQSVG